MAAFRDEAVAADPRPSRQRPKVICGLSGGVDSARWPPILIHEAIGEQLTCVFVDHGLLRSRTRRSDVVTLFRDHYNIPLVHVDASPTRS